MSREEFSIELEVEYIIYILLVSELPHRRSKVREVIAPRTREAAASWAVDGLTVYGRMKTQAQARQAL